MSLHNTFVAGYAQRRLAEIDLGKMLDAGLALPFNLNAHHPRS